MSPETEGDLAEFIRAANAPLSIRGGGTRPIGSAVDGQPLSTRAMTGIELYEPGALTLVARAGTPMAEIEAALAAEGQRLAFEPMDHRGCSVPPVRPPSAGWWEQTCPDPGASSVAQHVISCWVSGSSTGRGR